MSSRQDMTGRNNASAAGKIVLVTGASSGIGQATAIHFASLDFCHGLSITGRNADALTKTRDECLKAGFDANKILVVVADLTSVGDRLKLVNDTHDKFGRLDVLINSAGISPQNNDVIACDESTFDLIFNVNVKSVFTLTQLCIPLLETRRGCIVNVSSVVAQRPAPRVAVYSMSKAAIDQFTKCLALMLAPKGVRVNAVNPAVIRTNIFKAAGRQEAEIEHLLNVAGTLHPLGRVGEPVEVARCIAFLASDQASFVTGDTMLVDGGIACAAPKPSSSALRDLTTSMTTSMTLQNSDETPSMALATTVGNTSR